MRLSTVWFRVGIAFSAPGREGGFIADREGDMHARQLFRLFLMVSMMFASSAGFLPARAGQPSAESASRLLAGGISSATQGGVPVLPEGASAEWWQAV